MIYQTDGLVFLNGKLYVRPLSTLKSSVLLKIISRKSSFFIYLTVHFIFKIFSLPPITSLIKHVSYF